VVRRVGQVAWVALSWRSVEARHPDTPALAIAGNVLGGGVTSRLYQALVEKSLALSVTVVPWQLKDPALFSVFAPVRPGVEPAVVETAIREEIARFAREGVTEAEVQASKTESFATRLAQANAVAVAATRNSGWEGEGATRVLSTRRG